MMNDRSTVKDAAVVFVPVATSGPAATEDKTWTHNYWMTHERRCSEGRGEEG